MKVVVKENYQAEMAKRKAMVLFAKALVKDMLKMIYILHNQIYLCFIH